MHIYGTIPLSTIDYGDNICSVVFTSGCNLRCPYCQNPHVVLGKGHDVWPETLQSLVDRKNVIDHVVITGGEPTIHADLPEKLKELKDHTFKVKLDTNGTNYAMVDNILTSRLVDYVAMDIKQPVTLYDSPEIIERSIDAIIRKAPAYEFRTTLYPLYVRGKHGIKSIGRYLRGANRWYLQPFFGDGILHYDADVLPYTQDEMEELLETAKEYVPSAELRNFKVRG